MKVNLSSEPNLPLKIFVATPSLLTPPMACSTFIRMLEIKELSSFFSRVKKPFFGFFFGTKVLWLDQSLIPIKPLSPNISTSSGIASITANFLNCLKS